MNDAVDATHRLPQGDRIGEVAERYLDPDAVRAEAAGIADQAADLAPIGDQPGQQNRADQAGGSGQQDQGPFPPSRRERPGGPTN